MIETYTFLPLERVVYGPGSIGKLPHELQRLGAQRALVISGRTVAEETPVVSRIIELLGEAQAGLFKEIRQHVPQSDVARAAHLARQQDVDLLVSAGGGSAIDAAKAVAWELREGDRPAPPHIAVPTTLSAAEYSHVAGFTRKEGDERTKDRHRHVALTPRVIFLDAELTLHTPTWLWASSGIRALDHAVETLYAPGEHPIQSLMALEAVRELFACLPQDGQPDVGRRQRCQLAAWMSYFAPAAIQLGLSHVLSKSFGTTHQVPHGITSCITLPHAMRYMAQTQAPALARMARALQVAGEETPEQEAALAAADAVAGLIQRLGLPSRLRDVDVPREAIADIARAAAADRRVAEPLARHVLQEAW